MLGLVLIFMNWSHEFASFSSAHRIDILGRWVDEGHCVIETACRFSLTLIWGGHPLTHGRASTAKGAGFARFALTFPPIIT